MAAKREQILWEVVWPISERLEKSFSLTAILSGSVLLFDSLTGEEQKQLIADVRDGKLEHLQISVPDFRNRVIEVLEELAIYRKKKKPRQQAKTSESA